MPIPYTLHFDWVFARPGFAVCPPAIYSGGVLKRGLGRANYTINMFHTNEESTLFTAWFFIVTSILKFCRDKVKWNNYSAEQD